MEDDFLTHDLSVANEGTEFYPDEEDNAFTSFDYKGYCKSLMSTIQKLSRSIVIRNWVIFIETLILIWRFL